MKWLNRKVPANQLQAKMYMDSKCLIELAAEACDDRKANDIQLIRINEVSSLADWILVTNGLSDVQVRSIIGNVEEKIKTAVIWHKSTSKFKYKV